MKLKIKNKKDNFINVSESIFNIPFNESLIHQVIKTYSLTSRKGTKSQKNRSEVSGSNKKPWKQKGTGNARAGSRKSPIWRSGGITFNTNNKLYKQKINKKMYKNSIKIIVSELIRKNNIYIYDDFYVNYPKTKLLVSKLNLLSFDKNILIVKDKIEKNLLLASRNLYNVKVYDVIHLNPLLLMSFKTVIFTLNAIKLFEEVFK